LLNFPQNILEILQSCRTLPSVPAVVLQVLNLSQDPDISTIRLANVIARDPALTAKFLKVANSAWCGVRNEITTLDRAVNLVGLNGAMSLALSFSLVRGLQKPGDENFNHRAYWRRSAIAAAAAQSIGSFINVANKDELFLSGLLQDIGILALNEALPAYASLAARANGEHDELVEMELKELRTDHAQVGSWILRKWGLPSRLIEAVGSSHEQEGIEDQLARSVAVSGRIAEIWANPNTAAATASAVESARTFLELSNDQFDQILAKIAADFPETIANLDIEVGDEAFVNRLLDQARDALAEINLRALQEARHFAVQAQRDALTSLYNRAYLNEILGKQLDLGRAMQPLTLIFIDIDKFKSINDAYGHHSGDAILVSVSQAIQSATRNCDTIVRFGGDEFVVLLNNANEDIGAEIAERIRSMVAQRLYDAGEGNWIQVTVSVGWASSSSSCVSSAKELLESADRSLYAAKTAGRNRVVRAM
jgi:diguanylate cyclase (GGDEF)-like protein